MVRHDHDEEIIVIPNLQWSWTEAEVIWEHTAYNYIPKYRAEQTWGIELLTHGVC